MIEPYITILADVELDSTGWVAHPSGGLVTALPLRDKSTGLFARLSYQQQLAWCDRNGASLMTLDQHRDLARYGHYIRPVTLVRTESDAKQMRGREFCEEHDRTVTARLIATHWDGRRAVANVGKHFLAVENGRPVVPPACVNVGWSKGPGRSDFIQEPGHHHDSVYTDYSQLFQPWTSSTVEKADGDGAIMRTTIRKGSRGGDVSAWQIIVGADPDGSFGPQTEAFTKAWQANHDLVADGIVGPKSWIAAGEKPAVSRISRPEAPACLAALRDANARWPLRRKISDGIMGDSAHQATKSDHNLGNACDVTHDPSSGCNGQLIADAAIQDERVSYVIWNRQIYNRARLAEGWRPYNGVNGHTHHCHISVLVSRRHDDSPWGWA